jgi:hypothetical protein
MFYGHGGRSKEEESLKFEPHQHKWREKLFALH